MDLNKRNTRYIRGLILFAVLLYVGLQHLNVVIYGIRMVIHLLSPFGVGICIAFILNVPMRSIEKRLFGRCKQNSKLAKSVKRPISLIISILLIIGILGVVIFLVVPELLRTLRLLGESIPIFITNIQDWAIETLRQYPEIVDYIEDMKFDWESVSKSIVGFLGTGATSILNSTVSIATWVASSLTNFVISFVFAIYILLQKERLGSQIKKALLAYLPEGKPEKILYVVHLADKTFSNFITGQCVEAVILGSMFVLTMSILKLPYALLIGVLIAFMALIPIFGAFIGCFLGAFLILMISPIQALGFLVLFIILQQVEGNLIYPHVVGNSVGLPSIWVLVAVTLGGSLMGITGMLIFIPITSVLYALVKADVTSRFDKKKIKEEEVIEENLSEDLENKEEIEKSE